MNAIMQTNFHGTVLYGQRIQNAVYVALKPMVEAMGLQWAAQLKRIKRNKALAQGVSIMDMPSAGGLQPTIALKLDLLPGWLTTIEAARVKGAEVRAKIELFQGECYEVLAEHFGSKQKPVNRATIQQESLGVRMAREARLLFGKKAGAEVWFARGLPRTTSMDEPPHQHELFTR